MSEIAQAGNASAKPAKTNERLAWPILAVVWIAGMTAPANMAKVTTLAPVLMEAFNIAEASIGWVIALFYIVGVILAFPAASVCNKMGLKVAIVVALVCGIAGGLLGIVSSSLGMFMASRVVEGASMGIMAVAGAAAISPWFPNSKKGLPLSIWALWVSVPTIVFPMLYSWLTETTGTWQTSWWLMVGVGVVALILVLVFYRDPNFIWTDNEELVAVDVLPTEEQPKGSIMKALKMPEFWVVMLVILVDGIGFMAVEGFLTTYAYTNVGCTISEAATLLSASAIVGAIASPIAGAVSDKIHSRKIVLLVGLIFAVVFMWLVFTVTTYAQFAPIMVVKGLYAGIVGASTWSLISEVMPDDAITGGTAGMSFFQNGGFFIGAILFGSLVAVLGGWAETMHMIVVPAYVVAIIVLLVFWKRLP